MPSFDAYLFFGTKSSSGFKKLPKNINMPDNFGVRLVSTNSAGFGKNFEIFLTSR